MLNLHNELKQNVKINEKERKKRKKDCSHLDSGNMVHSGLFYYKHINFVRV